MGLALFLGDHAPQIFSIPLEVDEQVVVQRRFVVKPLLPLLAVDGHFRVWTLTDDLGQLSEAFRNAMSRMTCASLPTGVRPGKVPSDYENPVQASPVSRPHTGSVTISHAQTYGDSPTDWRKQQLIEFVREVAADVDASWRRLTRP